MQKMKRIGIVVILLVLLVIGCTACGEPVFLPQGDFSQVLNRELQPIVVENNQIKLLQITDTHFMGNDCKNDRETLAFIEDTIRSEKFDLVVITGDLVEGYNKKSTYNKQKALDDIAQLFERNQQYWSYVAGNNDGELGGSNQDIFAYLVRYPYCLISDVGVGGIGNYNVDFVDKENNLIHSIFMVDSRMRDADGNLMPIDDTQTEWYQSKTAELIEKGVKSSVFMHMPSQMFMDAYKNGESANTIENFATEESINTHPYSSHFDKAVLDSKNNGMIATGHTHGSTYAKFYQDMFWVQLNASGAQIWSGELKTGMMKIEIDTTQQTFKQMYRFTKIEI